MATLGILKSQLALVPPLQKQLISRKKSPLFLVAGCTFSEVLLIHNLHKLDFMPGRNNVGNPVTGCHQDLFCRCNKDWEEVGTSRRDLQIYKLCKI